uniref:Uncharacterized protein MANES_17G076600 n=1 Tax=Rhizophora mucronata TaxID=61149 RepID=A0A2P2QU19_RHIMU
MAFCYSKLMGPTFSPITGSRDSSTTIKQLPAIQVMSLKEQKLHTRASFNVLRRETLLYLTVETLVGATIFSTESAEAQVGRLENKKKVAEKLEKLREKAGVSKAKPSPDENKPPPPTPFQTPKERSAGPLTEAILP